MGMDVSDIITVDDAFKEATAPGNNDAYDFQFLLSDVSRAFSESGNMNAGIFAIEFDQNEALETYYDLCAIPDLILDARGEEGLALAARLEKELQSVGKQLIFDQNTMELRF